MNKYQYDEYYFPMVSEFEYHDNLDYEEEEYVSRHYNGRSIRC